MNNKPIGILSGTFDPIHLGHIHLATSIYESCDLQKIFLIPCQQSPLRPPPIASGQDRLNMIKLATKNLPFLDLDDYEILSPSISYTTNTLEYFRQKYPATPLALIIGTDAFNTFDQWYKWEKILDLAHMIVANRPNYQRVSNEPLKTIVAKKQVFSPAQLQKKPFGLIYFADIKPLPIAATEVRTLIKQQKNVAKLIAPEVLKYIKEKKLYID